MIIRISKTDTAFTAVISDETDCLELFRHLATLAIAHGYAIGSVIDGLENAAYELKDNVHIALRNEE
jgi:hypothetical protein